jgi:uncharacterized membrane protein YbhN (UPF0104 family)
LKWLFLVIKLIVVSLALWYIFRDLDFKKVKLSFKQVAWYVFGLGVIIQYIILLAQSLRWKLMIRESAVRWWECFAYVAVSYSLGPFSPSKIASDSLVAWFMGRKRHLALKSVSSLLMGRMVGMLILAVFLIVSLPGHLWMVNSIMRLLRTMNALWLFGIAGVLGIMLLVSLKFKFNLKDKAMYLLNMLGNPVQFAWIVFFSSLIQGGYILMPYGLFHFMDIPVSFINVLFLIPLLAILTYLPVVPSVIGIREGLYIFFFTLLPGVDKEAILACFGVGYVVFAVTSVFNIALVLLILGKPQGKPDKLGNGDGAA